jgi:hypothetical protein
MSPEDFAYHQFSVAA